MMTNWWLVAIEVPISALVTVFGWWANSKTATFIGGFVLALALIHALRAIELGR